MKFPNSAHAEGWLSHIENAEPGHTTAATTAGLSSPKPKIGIRPQGPGRRLKPSEIRFDSVEAGTAAGLSDTTALPGATIRPTASASSASVQRPSTNSTPWLIGAGVGAALIVGAVAMSRHTASVKTPDSTPIVTGQASTQPATPSAEDQQLAAAPSGAGPDSGTTTPAEPAAVTPTPAPTPEPATQVAEAKPAPMFTKSTPAPDAAPRAEVPTPQPQAVAKAPAPKAEQPVVRTLTSPADTVAQASPPPATLTDTVPPAQATQPTTTVNPATALAAPAATTPPVTTAMAPATTPVTPAATTPAPTAPATTADANTANLPLAQATPTPAPAATEDAGITVKVRSALVADAVLSGVPISVSTNNGVVKLEGQAPDAQAREHATAVVASTLGVKGVDNRLTVPPVAQLQLPPAATQGS